MPTPQAITLTVTRESYPLKEPFNITGHRMTVIDVIVVTLQHGPHVGRGEASGVFYFENSDPPSMIRQIEAVRGDIEAGIDRRALQRILLPGGARNALDCAFWDLEAKMTGVPAWRIAGLNSPRPLLTTFTISANAPEKMAADASAYKGAKALKLKLTGQPIDADRVRAVRAVAPAAWIGVDGNQGFTRASLEALLPVLIDNRIQLIEQPFRIGQDRELAGLHFPIQIAADESIQQLADIPGLIGRYDVINIKLDKCGGLTEGLTMAREARRLGLAVMVGNMLGTSLAMAPAFLLGQLCDVVDLDGPVFLTEDRTPSVRYSEGMIYAPAMLWGIRPPSVLPPV
jgi:L-alanine-DL-glutamate epimerase-like enolase superfamily enzyme